MSFSMRCVNFSILCISNDFFSAPVARLAAPLGFWKGFRWAERKGSLVGFLSSVSVCSVSRERVAPER